MKKLGRRPDRIFLHTEEEHDELRLLQKEELQPLKQGKQEAFSDLSADSKGTSLKFFEQGSFPFQ